MISVIVSSYDRPEHLWCNLMALAHQTVPFEEIIVVNDGFVPPGDLERDHFRLCAASVLSGLPVSFVWHPHDKFGLSRSRNEGVRIARGDWFWFIDEDILLNPKAHEAAVTLVSQKGEVVYGGYYKYLKGMGVTIADVEAWDDLWNMRLPEVDVGQHLMPEGYDVREAYFRQGRIGEQVFDKPDKTFWQPFILLGGNMLVPKIIYDATKGFDEGIGMYGGEDGEFSIQVSEAGYGFRFSKAIAGAHLAHSRHAQAEADHEAKVLAYIAKKHPAWFADGKPAWGNPRWKHPKWGVMG